MKIYFYLCNCLNCDGDLIRHWRKIAVRNEYELATLLNHWNRLSRRGLPEYYYEPGVQIDSMTYAQFDQLSYHNEAGINYAHVR